MARRSTAAARDIGAPREQPTLVARPAAPHSDPSGPRGSAPTAPVVDDLDAVQRVARGVIDEQVRDVHAVHHHAVLRGADAASGQAVST